MGKKDVLLIYLNISTISQYGELNLTIKTILYFFLIFNCTIIK